MKSQENRIRCTILPTDIPEKQQKKMGEKVYQSGRVFLRVKT